MLFTAISICILVMGLLFLFLLFFVFKDPSEMKTSRHKRMSYDDCPQKTFDRFAAIWLSLVCFVWRDLFFCFFYPLTSRRRLTGGHAAPRRTAQVCLFVRHVGKKIQCIASGSIFGKRRTAYWTKTRNLIYAIWIETVMSDVIAWLQPVLRFICVRIYISVGLPLSLSSLRFSTQPTRI